jgi:hypothetical protein
MCSSRRFYGNLSRPVVPYHQWKTPVTALNPKSPTCRGPSIRFPSRVATRRLVDSALAPRPAKVTTGLRGSSASVRNEPCPGPPARPWQRLLATRLLSRHRHSCHRASQYVRRRENLTWLRVATEMQKGRQHEYLAIAVSVPYEDGLRWLKLERHAKATRQTMCECRQIASSQTHPAAQSATFMPRSKHASVHPTPSTGSPCVTTIDQASSAPP